MARSPSPVSESGTCELVASMKEEVALKCRMGPREQTIVNFWGNTKSLSSDLLGGQRASKDPIQ